MRRVCARTGFTGAPEQGSPWRGRASCRKGRELLGSQKAVAGGRYTVGWVISGQMPRELAAAASPSSAMIVYALVRQTGAEIKAAGDLTRYGRERVAGPEESFGKRRRQDSIGKEGEPALAQRREIARMKTELDSVRLERRDSRADSAALTFSVAFCGMRARIPRLSSQACKNLSSAIERLRQCVAKV